MAEIVCFDGPDIRHTVKGSSLDLLLYKSWKAEAIREVRTGTFLFFDTWERRGSPLDVLVQFNDRAPLALNDDGPGYAVREITGSTAAGVTGMRITGTCPDGDPIDLVVGEDWVGRTTVTLVGVALLILVVFFGMQSDRKETEEDVE